MSLDDDYAIVSVELSLRQALAAITAIDVQLAVGVGARKRDGAAPSELTRMLAAARAALVGSIIETTGVKLPDAGYFDDLDLT
jgi:hypothetical protein